jgi:hypothetical protein
VVFADVDEIEAALLGLDRAPSRSAVKLHEWTAVSERPNYATARSDLHEVFAP